MTRRSLFALFAGAALAPLAKLLPAAEKNPPLGCGFYKGVTLGESHPLGFPRLIAVDCELIDPANQLWRVRYTFDQKGVPDMAECLRHLNAPLVTYTVGCS